MRRKSHIDSYAAGTLAFYTPPPFGLGFGAGNTHGGPVEPIRSPIDALGLGQKVFSLYPKPTPPPIEFEPMKTIDLSEGVQVHIHPRGGSMEVKGWENPVILDDYQTRIADMSADILGLEKKNTLVRKKNCICLA